MAAHSPRRGAVRGNLLVFLAVIIAGLFIYIATPAHTELLIELKPGNNNALNTQPRGLNYRNPPDVRRASKGGIFSHSGDGYINPQLHKNQPHYILKENPPQDEPKYIAPLNNNWRFPPEMPFLDALATCETLKCVRDAHLQPKGETKFNFPHFMIAGWSKCATTSLYKNFNRHPETINPVEKEPMLFTNHCKIEHGRLNCPEQKVSWYIKDVLKLGEFLKNKGQKATFEATPRIMQLGPDFAEGFQQLLPWVKLIAIMREPINRGMSKLIMLDEKNETTCLQRRTIAQCMLEDRMAAAGQHLLARYEWESVGNPKRSYYSTPLKAWLDNFPKEQISLIQYEELIDVEKSAAEIKRVKQFLGLDPNDGVEELEVSELNCRHCRIHPEGWDMKRSEYEELIRRVKPDVLEIVRVIDKHGLGNGTRWMQNWQRVWADNLKSCDSSGNCKIKLG